METPTMDEFLGVNENSVSFELYCYTFLFLFFASPAPFLIVFWTNFLHG